MLGYGFGTNSAYGAGIDVGANPTPKVDIAVNVPADYPGTFLEFKEELTQKLIDEGMDPSSFRITTTAVSIDTTDTDGWYVYDHYGSQASYDALNLSAEQKAKQPVRLADNSCCTVGGTGPMAGKTSGAIADFFPNNQNYTSNACKVFDKHIYSSVDDEGKASMVFAGYGTYAKSDFMIYPASSNSRRNFSFDLNPAVIDTHTLDSYGFFLNAGVKNGKVQGYALKFTNGHSASIQKIDYAIPSVGASAHEGLIAGTKVSGDYSMGLTTGQVVRLTVELNKDSVTIQYQKYDSSGNLGAIQDLVRDFKLDDTGLNGFGPFVNYSSHGCSSLSIMKFSDLEMSYEASAFDALKNVQYYEGAQQKYFINLTGTNNDPGIPEETLYGKPNQNYHDGINRMNQNEIFYISNTDDGQIVTDSTKGVDGSLTHQGLGSTNGFYASGDSYTQQIAEYIYTNFRDGVKFQQAEVESALPLANFYIEDANSASDDQIMTIHLQHLVNTNSTVPVNIYDKSRIGTSSGADGKLVKYHLTVTDPDNTIKYDQTVTDPAQLPDFVFDQNSKQGRYTFTLVVTDDKGNESKDFSTYITAFLDNEYPFIEGANTGKNIATITLTDTGAGIDEDGITFIEDGRGSGVAAYWVTNDSSAQPTEDDWETLPFAQHQFSFEQEIVNTDPLVVWVRDECGNIGNKAVFQPTHVRVEDPEGNPIDDYYVIGDKPIIVLPPDEDVPDPNDPENEKFSGWVTDGDDPVTPGTTPTPKDNEIIIRPSYSTDKAKLVYLPNGGTLADGVKAEQEVVSGSSILTKINDQNVVPTRTGYSFQGWKLLKTDDATNAADSAFINNANNIEEVTTQQARCVRNASDQNIIDRDTYYLVAQWKEGEYKLRLDPNGGISGNVKIIEPVKYAINIGTLTGIQQIPVSGRGIPTRPGYFFLGWSETNTNDTTKVFKKSTDTHANSITPIAAPTMPDGDKTIYAVWMKDTSQFLVHFDSNGGSNINDQAYGATATAYNTFMKPSRSGYTFEGWFAKTGINEDGTPVFGETEYKGGEAFIQKTDHTFVAKWAPKTDTKYTVDYYVNSGNKDAQGNYIYTKVNSLDDGTNPTKTYTATTESKVSVPNEDKATELTTSGMTYWYNAENTNNVVDGTVTGSPALSLKLYYDRYFSVDATKGGNGSGGVTGATGVKEGTNPTVSWKADEGSKVSKVVVDGVVRDDLLTQTSYTFENGVHENHAIYVEFATSTTSGGNTPGGDQPDPVVPATYQVKTSLVGNIDGSATITETTNLKAGANHSVTWNKGNYEINKIVVDGIDYDINSTDKVDFNGISANHEVVITLSKLPSLGGGTTAGQYTVTTNKYGGDETCIVTPTTVVDANGNAKIAWNAGSTKKYEIYKVFVDGVEKTDGKTSVSFTKIKGNHVVDVYFKEVDVDEPDFNLDENVKVTTQINGGPGTISGGAVLEKGSGYTVEWTAKDNRDANAATVDGDLDGDQKDTAYTHYELVNVIVDGKVVEPDEDNKVILSGITDDTDVQVNIRPVNYDVKTAIYGGGEVSKSRVLWKDQNYFNIMAKIPDINKLVLVTVDEQPVWRAEADPVTPAAGTLAVNDEVISSDQAANSATQSNTEQNAAGTDASDSASATETDEGAATDEGTQTDQGALTELETEDSDTTAVEITADELSQMSDEEIAALQELMGDDFLTRVAEADDVPEVQFDEATKRVNVNNISQDHVVRFYSIPNDEPYDGSDEKIKEVQDQYRDVVVKIVDQNGNPIAGQPGMMQNVKKGDPAKAEWNVPAGYELQGVTVNGVAVEAPDSSIDFTSLNDNTTVVVKLQKKLPNENKTIPNDNDPTYAVETSLQGGAGTISGSGTYSENVDADVSWTVADPETDEVKYVFVDGKKVDPSDMTTTENGGSFSFVGKNAVANNDGEHTVVVVIGPKDKTPTNVDKDGDGKPDTNVDTDGDGEPDVNVDTDGDGEQDINIVDEDGDGKPDPVDPTDPKKPNVNVDTDGDGEPDINKDTDGDGKPDINIVDEDGDGKPDPVDPKDPKKPNVNVDVTGDGKPDVNVDTDGDGKPDVNIVDKDGDGKPDPVDPTKPVIPDVNVVIDPETGEPIYNFDVPVTDPEDPKYWPTVNVDTDGDGKPDVNIDVDGDGTPDINIVDEDKNGKPDPIKPGTKPIPTINVDTDSDGIPDEGIDRNYGSPEFWQYVDEQMANQNGDNAIDNSKDKNDKSKKSKSSKTGDMTVPIAGGIALIALLSGLVLVLARRRKEN